MRPYIGVSGLMTADEADAVVGIYRDAWDQLSSELVIGPVERFESHRIPTHDLMIGVLASAKTLRGITNSAPLRYPRATDIGSIFSCQPEHGSFAPLNLVHVAPDGAPGQHHADIDDVLYAMQYGGARCQGVQINVPWYRWPRPDDLVRFRLAYPDARVVLQVRHPPRDEAAKWERSAWGVREEWALGRSAAALVEQLRLFVQMKLVTDVLLDASAGHGQAMEPIEEGPMGTVVTIVGALHLAFPNLGIGVAGGLSGPTLASIAPLLRRQQGSKWSASFFISMDAEGRLRDDSPGGGKLDLQKVRAYLRTAVECVSKGDL